MRYFLITLLCISTYFNVSANGTWNILNIPQLGRYDDIYFLNDSVGWTIGVVRYTNRDVSYVFKTNDGGANWDMIDSLPYYLRSIGFLNEQVGFIGTLDTTSFLKTVDGGYTWHSVVDTFTTKPKAICGISIVDSQTVYAVGAYSGSPCVLKSTDAGMNWKYINMTAHCTALIDVNFSSPLIGFVAGVNKPQNAGAIILRTTNGGNTWQPVYKSNANSKEYVWKIQRLDSANLFASVLPTAPTASSRVIRSQNGGQSWDTTVVVNFNSGIQSVGFLDSLHGYAGGYYPKLFRTLDGGATWDSLDLDDSYNRFWRISKDIAFLTGKQVYQYRDTTTTIPEDTGVITNLNWPSSRLDDKITLYPNPTKDKLFATIDLAMRSFAFVHIITATGQVELDLHSDYLPAGANVFNVDISRLSAGVHYVQLHSNLGITTKPFVVHK